MLGIDIEKFNLLSAVGTRDIIGIDFSSNNLKFAYVRVMPNKKELINLFSRNINGLSDADISKVIRSSVSELGAKNPDIIDILPSHLVITKNIEIPSVDNNEIKEIVNLQAGRHTPYSREEIIVDYVDIGAYKHSYTKILLVIVARSVVKRHSDLLDKAGLRLDRALLASEGLARSAAKLLKTESQDSPVGIVHIDEIFSDFSVVFKSKVLFIRSISIGTANLLLEKERYYARFMEELKRSLEAYQSEDIEKSPTLLILTGAIEELRDLETVLNSTLHVPARIASYFRNLAVSHRAQEAASAAKRLSFLNIIAPLFILEEMKVNLVPEEIRLRKALEERGRDLVKTGILVLTTLVIIFLILITKIYFKSAYLKNIDEKYQSLNKEAQTLEKNFLKVSLIKNYLANRGYSLEVLTELYNIAPLELQLNDIRFDEQGKFSIRGTGESMPTVFSFVDGMSKSKYFTDVKTKYTTKRKEGTKDVADFEITASLKKESK